MLLSNSSDPEMLGFVNQVLAIPQNNEHFGCVLCFFSKTRLSEVTALYITIKFPQSLGTSLNQDYTSFFS